MKLCLNDQEWNITTHEELCDRITDATKLREHELWIMCDTGQALCMLKNGTHAFLMYLKNDEHAGLVSKGNDDTKQLIEYRLSNGQVDEYPASWCIPAKVCYQVVIDFCLHNGARPDWIGWNTC